MKQILFVDDDKLLRDLYGMLMEGLREQWQTTLAADGESALKLLGQTAFDVVVSDMQMPGMNGVQLLTEVRQRHPQTSRIIISGMADQAKAADSLKCTHLFISKPVGAKALRATLTRIRSLDAYLESPSLRALAGKMGTMPTFPALYLEIMREMDSPSASIQSLARIITQDPAMTAKILQVANSAGLGLAERVSDPAEAVQHLGMSTVRSLALSAQVFGRFSQGRITGFSPDLLWMHLMKCGDLTRAIMLGEGAEMSEVEDAFTAGMLHDIGKLMLADNLPNEFREAMALARAEQIPLAQAEQRVLGATHAGLAAYLLGLWGLPAPIVEAVALYEEPRRSELKQFSALTAVHVANVLCGESDGATLDMEYLAEIGMAERVEEWRGLVDGG